MSKRDWNNFFTVQDMRSWSRRIDVDDIYACMAIHANLLLSQELEDAQKVYKCAGYGHYDTWIEDEKELDTAPGHKAKLICIEEIK